MAPTHRKVGHAPAGADGAVARAQADGRAAVEQVEGAPENEVISNAFDRKWSMARHIKRAAADDPAPWSRYTTVRSLPNTVACSVATAVDWVASRSAELVKRKSV